MIALDTNALVRLAVNDAPRERDAVVALMQVNRILLLTTVLLETEWVLRSRYGYRSQQVADFLTWLIELECCHLESEEPSRSAIRLLGEGLDFADALHLSSARSVAMHTLDRNFARRARKLGHTINLIEPAKA